MHRFIPFRLQLSYPSSRPWYTEACGEAVVLKQLAFTSWKAISVPSTKLGTSLCLPSGEPENNTFLISSVNSQTSLPPPIPGGIELSLFLVYDSPSIPSLTSCGCTADTAREEAECLNSVFACESGVQIPSLSVPTLPCPWTLCPFLLTRWRACCETSTQILQPAQMALGHMS